VEFCDLRSAVDTPQVLRGVEAVQALLVGWSEAWDYFGSEVYKYIDAEPYVICDMRRRGRSDATHDEPDRAAPNLYPRLGPVNRVVLASR